MSFEKRLRKFGKDLKKKVPRASKKSRSSGARAKKKASKSKKPQKKARRSTRKAKLRKLDKELQEALGEVEHLESLLEEDAGEFDDDLGWDIEKAKMAAEEIFHKRRAAGAEESITMVIWWDT